MICVATYIYAIDFRLYIRTLQRKTLQRRYQPSSTFKCYYYWTSHLVDYWMRYRMVWNGTCGMDSNSGCYDSQRYV